MERKINRQLLAMALLTMALTLTLALLLFHRSFDRQAKAELDLHARTLTAAYTALDQAGQNPQALAAFAVPELRVTLIDPTGLILYESDALPQAMDNHLSRPEVADALATGQGQASRPSDTLGSRTYYVALRLPDGRVLRVARRVDSLYTALGRLLPVMGAVVLALAALSVWLARVLTRGLLRPIEHMAVNPDAIDLPVPYSELEPFVSALRAQQAQKQEVERMRQEFTANISHELKTPLTSISGYAEMIETGMAQPDDVRDFAGKIRFEAGRLIRLIGDIIQLGRLDDPGAPKTLVMTDLWELAQSTAQYLDFSASQAGVTLTVTGAPAPVTGDRGMLEELIYNLCDNAIRYNRPGGSVTLETGLGPDGTPSLTVADTGIGIPQAHQSRIFERFYRVDKSRSRESGGTGLGLAIVKHVAIQHGAEIDLKSREGEGTAITVRFPGGGSGKPDQT